MQKLLTVLIVALMVEAIGVVYLSKGLKQIGEVQTISAGEIFRVVKLGATNGNILFGVLLETIFFGALLYLLSVRDVSLIWPLTSLGFVLTAVAAKYINHEEVSPLRWCGILIIVVGASLVTWSEKQKERAATSPTSTAAAGLER